MTNELTIICAIFVGMIVGFFATLGLYTEIDIAISKLAKTFSNILERQIKIYERQCRIFYILRIRYKDKLAIKWFNKIKKRIK